MNEILASPGDRINQYVVERMVAVGGSACVFQARDPLIGRWVALKILSDFSAATASPADPALEEARACSSFTHPNVVTVYEAGKHNGAPFLVIEWIDGTTLEDRLAGGPLSPDAVLTIFRQVADALEAAHGCGLVHRDLKPSNIMISEFDVAKILDFGIASGPGLHLQENPENQASGTVGYMAPEQARGESVGPTADIFAFGRVLEEALTGRSAGETSTNNTTERPGGLLGRRLLKLARACQEEAPQQRLKNGGAVVRELDLIAKQSSSRNGGLASRRTIICGLGVMAATLLTIVLTERVGFFAPRSSQPQRGIEQLPIEGLNPVLLGDNESIAFIAAGRHEIWSTPTGVSTSSRRWSGPQSVVGLAAIPRTTGLLFAAAENEQAPWIWELPAGKHLARKIIRGHAPAISPSGKHIVAIQEQSNGIHNIVISRRDGTDLRVLHSFRDSTIPLSCAFLPDSEAIAVSATDTVRKSWLLRIHLKDGASSVLHESQGIAFRGIAVGDNPARLVWPLRNHAEEESHLMATSLRRPRPSVLFPGPGRATHPSLSADGSVLTFQTEETVKQLIEIEVRPGSRPAGGGYIEIENTAGASQPRISPDGTKVVFTSAQGDLWVLDRPSGLAGPLLTTGIAAFNPAWSPEGDSIVFSCLRDKRSDLWIAGSDGSIPERLTQSVGNSFQPVWHPDGETILFISDREGPEDLYSIRPSDGRIRRLGHDGAVNPAVSPDGTYVAYLVGGYGPHPLLRLSRFIDGHEELETVWERPVRVDRWGGSKPRFSPGGGWLAYDQSGAETGADIWAVRVSGPADSLPVRLTRFHRPTCLLGWFDWGSDGRIIACTATVRHRIQVLRDADLWLRRALD